MCKNKQTPPQFSANISGFCAMAENAKRDYEWNREEVNRLDRLDYKERAKVATKLSQCRQLRRNSKDTVEILEPFIMFLDSDKGKNMMNLVREALGKTRKVEERMTGRTYRFKVYEAGDVSNG